MDKSQITEAVAIAIYGAFTRNPNPELTERRWLRLQETTKDQWRREAEAAIQTYQTLKGNSPW